MRRSVSSHLEMDLGGVADVVASLAVAADAPVDDQHLTATVDGAEVTLHEVHDDHGTRLHHAPSLGPGHLVLSYRATVIGPSPPPAVTELDVIRYRAPEPLLRIRSAAAFARAEFDGSPGWSLLDAVTSWVGHAGCLRRRLQPADRRRGQHPARPPGRVPRLRAPRDRAAARLRRPRPARLGLRARLRRWTSTRSPRPGSTATGSSSTRRVLAPRCAGAHRHRTRRGRHGVPHHDRRRPDPHGLEVWAVADGDLPRDDSTLPAQLA